MPYMLVYGVGLILEILESALQRWKIRPYFGVLCLWGILDRVGLQNEQIALRNTYNTVTWKTAPHLARMYGAVLFNIHSVGLSDSSIV